MTIDGAIWKRAMLEPPTTRSATDATGDDDVPSPIDDVAADTAELAWIVAAQTDPQAFAPLYERYVDLVYRFCLRRLADPERAADATSIVFTRAIVALPHYTPRDRPTGSTFRSWLMTIARNVVIDDTRRRKPTSSLDTVVLADRQPSPEDRAIAADDRIRIEAALAQLVPRQRQIVELRQIGLRGAEIADVLGMTVSAVKTAHFRAYARLRELLADPDDTRHQEERHDQP